MRHLAQLLVSKDYGSHHFDVNEGVQFVGRLGSSGFDRRYFSALSYSHPLPGKWGYTLEISGFSRANDANPGTLTLLAAPTYNVSPRMVIDAGVYYTVYGNAPHLTSFVGLTYSVADLYHLHRARPVHRDIRRAMRSRRLRPEFIRSSALLPDQSKLRAGQESERPKKRLAPAQESRSAARADQSS